MRYFEDLAVGDQATSQPMTVGRDDMVAFASKYDPQWFHADINLAKDSIFGEVVASGIYTAALWRKLDDTINGDVAYICGVAWEDVRWPKAVRAGDRLRAASEILEKRASNSDPTRGVATFLYQLLDAHDEVVFTCRSINLIRRRPVAD